MIAWFLRKISFEYTIFSLPIADNISLTLKTSLISNCFVCLILLLYVITTIYSFGYLTFEREKRKIKFHILIIFSVAITICLALSANLFTAFVFYDLLSVFTYLLVRFHGDENSEEHALTYAMYLLIPSMIFLLPAILCVFGVTENVDFTAGGVFSDTYLSKLYVNILFALFMYGISKTALYPLHKWLIHAMVAPAPVSALLHAVLVVKGGLFLLYRVINDIFGLEFLRENIYTLYGLYWPIYIAGCSIILPAMSAITSSNIKQRLAYSTISQIGYISLCLFCFTEKSVFGAQIQFLSHSFAKISLFYYAGYLLARYHVSNIGELKYDRNHFSFLLSMLWLVPVANLMSMPLTIGFLSKHAMIAGSINNVQDIIVLCIFAIGTLLCVVYLYPIAYHLMLFNKNEYRFTQQFWSTFFVYFATLMIAIAIVGGFLLLH